MWSERGSDAFGPDLLLCLAERECLRLGKDVGGEDVVVFAEWVEGVGKPDEIDGDELGALVDQLIEAVLAVGSWLAPVDRAGLVVDLCT